MSATLEIQISPALKKRMQGKTCFNFKTIPDAKLIADLKKTDGSRGGPMGAIYKQMTISGGTLTIAGFGLSSRMFQP